MAAAIAHEVKNPLGGIEVMSGLLKRQLPDSPDAQTILGDIIKEAKMANRIVQEVLAFVRPIRLQVEDTSVADVIRDAITMADTHALKGDVELRVDIPEALRPIQGDSAQLRQIFTNFLTNAFEAMNSAGHVEISAIAQDGDEETGPDHGGPTVIITVSDDGPRIPPEVTDRIFQPVLHHQAAGFRPRASHRTQDRRRARRPDRRRRASGRRDRLPRDASVPQSAAVVQLSWHFVVVGQQSCRFQLA